VIRRGRGRGCNHGFEPESSGADLASPCEAMEEDRGAQGGLVRRLGARGGARQL
jgi:hypothetical protein